MEIDYKGADCVVIKDKNIVIVTDPGNLKVKALNDPDAVVLATQPKFAPKNSADNFVIDMPGEYEHKDVSVRGISVAAHLSDSEKAEDATLYRIEASGVSLAVVGHTRAPIDDDDLENLGPIDIVIIPVGGGGYTLDARDAATIVRQITPKVIIPVHYNDGKTSYELPQDNLDDFIKEMGGRVERQTVFKIKNINNLPENTTIYALSPTK